MEVQAAASLLIIYGNPEIDQLQLLPLISPYLMLCICRDVKEVALF